MPKLRIEECGHAAAGAHRPRRRRHRGREQVPASTTSRRSTCARWTTPQCASRRSGGLKRDPRRPATTPRRWRPRSNAARGDRPSTGEGQPAGGWRWTPHRLRATVGEISEALERDLGSLPGGGRAPCSGVYGAAVLPRTTTEFDAVRGRGRGSSPEIRGPAPAHAGGEARTGRPRPRHAKVVATAFADLGFDVDIGRALRRRPRRSARQARRERRARRWASRRRPAAHKTLMPEAGGGA